MGDLEKTESVLYFTEWEAMMSVKMKNKNKNHMQNNDNESKVVQTWHGKYFVQFNTNYKSEWNILSKTEY